ncbi:MAG: tRNA (cytidine(34)-2'-O)-methyltransferase [Candidatus Riflebacteria bacterium]|nr:tRNA (cytidine(34)-2'-O)-methyltransferase [Candidatus Riflebacteria bacterium]
MSDQGFFIVSSDSKPLSVVLIEPDIPQNTGNIARLCMATNCELVLVRPFGFRLTDAGLQRAGMDYWKVLNPVILNDLDEFFEWSQNRRLFFLSAHGNHCYSNVQYNENDVLVFGSESTGLPSRLLKWAQERNSLITLPMIKNARCINVSSSVSASVYEALKQIHNW